MPYRVGVDVGGTFTDSVFIDEETGEIRTMKVPTTPQDQSLGFLESLLRSGINPAATVSLVHGCTVALNAILTRSGAKTGLITTDGYREVLVMGRGQRPSIAQFDPQWRRSFADGMKPLVPRYLRRTVKERTGSEGKELVPLDLEQVEREVRFLERCGVQAIAICFLNSYGNGQHEREALRLVGKLLPGVYCCASSEVHPVFKEYPRFSTCALNAYVGPLVDGYLSRTEEKLRTSGYGGDLLMMQSSGGVLTSAMARERPVYTIQSGPVGGAIAARYFGEATACPNLITIDIGGTSCDVTILTGGENILTTELEVEHDMMVALPSISVKSVGAGGGSIAWIDHLKALKVGPQSAGAVPGPACYGRGGTQPTVTDAQLVLGWLRPEHFLGGQMALYPELAAKALQPIASHLGASLPEAARAVGQILVANMSEAAKEISLYSGVDPRDYALFSFGSAGPMFATQVARELGNKEALIPPFPGEMCAFGLTASDLRVDLGQSAVRLLEDLTPEEIGEVYEGLEGRAIETLRRQGVPAARVVLSRYFDGRYWGQTWDTISVPVPGGKMDGVKAEQMKANFHAAHQRSWGYSLPTYSVKLIMARVAATAVLGKPRLRKLSRGGESPEGALVGEVPVFLERDSVRVPLYLRGKLLAGNQVKGPAIIQQPTATTVLLPGDEARVDDFGNLRITWR